MLDTFLYYFMLPTTVFVCAAGTYYVFNKENVNTTIANVSWEMSRLYIDCVDIQESIKTTLKKNGILTNEDDGYIADDEDSDDSEESSQPQDIEQNLVYYNRDDKLCFISDSVNDNTVTEALRRTPSIIFIRNTIGDAEYYKRTLAPSKKDSYSDVFFEKPFIQVEYIEEGGEVYDIHKYLTSFYVNGNAILDRVFLEWYLSYFYDKTCSEKYILRIIDKDINMFDIQCDQTVVLRNDMYEVTKIMDTLGRTTSEGKGKFSDSESDNEKDRNGETKDCDENQSNK